MVTLGTSECGTATGAIVDSRIFSAEAFLVVLFYHTARGKLQRQPRRVLAAHVLCREISF
jgi:hypothetical protein